MLVSPGWIVVDGWVEVAAGSLVKGGAEEISVETTVLRAVLDDGAAESVFVLLAMVVRPELALAVQAWSWLVTAAAMAARAESVAEKKSPLSMLSFMPVTMVGRGTEEEMAVMADVAVMGMREQPVVCVTAEETVVVAVEEPSVVVRKEM